MKSEQRAIQYVRRSADTILARDWGAYADCQAEAFRFEDRRTGLQTSHGKAENIEMARVMADLGVDKIDIDVIETRGEHFALCRITNHVDEYVVTTLSVFGVDDDGRGLVFIVFDDDDADAARAELDALAADPG
jgi:hypothetical protein